MKVKELIEKLQALDEEMEIYVESEDDMSTFYNEVLDVKKSNMYVPFAKDDPRRNDKRRTSFCNKLPVYVFVIEPLDRNVSVGLY